MEESKFQNLADNLLNQIASALEGKDQGGELEVELQNGILHIQLPDTRQYVINRHAPTSQIWMSSPVSGASHFVFEQGKWLDTRNKTEFLEKFLNEINSLMSWKIEI